MTADHIAAVKAKDIEYILQQEPENVIAFTRRHYSKGKKTFGNDLKKALEQNCGRFREQISLQMNADLLPAITPETIEKLTNVENFTDDLIKDMTPKQRIALTHSKEEERQPERPAHEEEKQAELPVHKGLKVETLATSIIKDYKNRKSTKTTGLDVISFATRHFDKLSDDGEAKGLVRETLMSLKAKVLAVTEATKILDDMPLELQRCFFGTDKKFTPEQIVWCDEQQQNIFRVNDNARLPEDINGLKKGQKLIVTGYISTSEVYSVKAEGQNVEPIAPEHLARV